MLTNNSVLVQLYYYNSSTAHNHTGDTAKGVFACTWF